MFIPSLYFEIMSAVKDVNKKGLSIKRITPPIDLSSKENFLVEMFNHRPSELGGHQIQIHFS